MIRLPSRLVAPLQSDFFYLEIYRSSLCFLFMSAVRAAAQAAASSRRRREAEASAPSEEEGECDDDVAELYATLIEELPPSVGKDLSKTERTARGVALRGTSLTYGEVNFDPFAKAVARIKAELGGFRSDGGVFYDLGSGTGKAVFAATMVHRFDRCVGVELLESLHGCAEELHARFDALIAPRLRHVAEIALICGDITDPASCDWSDATLCFANSTCFGMKLMRAMAARATECAVGTWFITLTKELPSELWVTRSATRHKMSWGAATLFVQEKVS